jgi:AAA-like domain
MSWDEFLKQVARDLDFLAEETTVFLERFSKQNSKPHKPDKEVAKELRMAESSLQRKLSAIYNRFSQSYPKLNTNTKGKFNILLDLLEQLYDNQETKNIKEGFSITFNLQGNITANSNIKLTSGISEDLYLESPIISSCYKDILKPGCLLRIKAPWQMGKTELMSRVLNYAGEKGCQIVVVNLRDATDTDFNNLNQFLKWLCTNIRTSLSNESKEITSVDEHWNHEIGNGKNKCKTYFEKYLLSGNKPLVLGLDSVDKVFTYREIASEFLGMLRTRHEEAKTRPIWGKFRQILAYTEDYREIDINQSPFNTGILINLPEFTHQQVKDLACQYELSWNSSSVNQLMDMVGGHPYLVHEAIKYVAREIVTLDELLENAPTQAGIYSDILQRYGRRLKKSPNLTTEFKKVVMSDDPVELHPDLADVLYSLGLIKFEGNHVRPSYKLYRQYFYSRYRNG